MNTNNRYIFLVDDEPIQNEMLKDYLNERFLYDIKTFSNGEEALAQLNLNPEIMVLDYHLSAQNATAQNGVDILKAVKEKSPSTQVIMLSGQDSLAVAVDSMKYGAYDYVVKGETAFAKTENIINNASEMHKLKVINKAQKSAIRFLAVSLIIIFLVSIYLYLYAGTKPV